MMADKPIIFSGAMIKALLESRKTQTRRVLKPQPIPFYINAKGHANDRGDGVECEVAVETINGEPRIRLGRVITAQGLRYAPGDRLWIRETFVIEDTREYDEIAEIPNDGRPVRAHKDLEGSWRLIPHYRATEPEPHIVPLDRGIDGDDRTIWRSPIHMPRWASRLTMIVESVRVQRLQDISEADARAEGAYVSKASARVADDYATMAIAGQWFATARGWYQDLWGRLHGPDAWSLNPFVAAIGFRVIKANIDSLEAR